MAKRTIQIKESEFKSLLEKMMDKKKKASNMGGRKWDLIDAVIGRMKEDIGYGDWTAIEELLNFVPTHNLIGFLPEERWNEFSDLKD